MVEVGCWTQQPTSFHGAYATRDAVHMLRGMRGGAYSKRDAVHMLRGMLRGMRGGAYS